MGTEFTIGDVIKILGIPRERFKAWVWEKHVVPSIKPAEGLGTVNKYSTSDIYGIALFDYLIKRGFSREAASRMYQVIISFIPESYFESKSFMAQPFYVAVITRDESNGFGVATILEKNFSDSFEKIFLRFDDIHKTKDVSELDVDYAVVVNLRKLFEAISLRIP